MAALGVVSAEQAVVSGPYACALTMTIAATLCGAVAAHKAEVAAAVVGFHTGAIYTALSTHRAAYACHVVHGVACLAAALVAMGLVVAVLGLIAVMVPICTLVLRGAGQEGPGCPRTPTCQPITGAAESTFHAAATSILAPPGTPATVGTPQAQGTLGCLSTAQGAALRSPEQPPAASSHTSKGQVGGAQTLLEAAAPDTVLPAPICTLGVQAGSTVGQEVTGGGAGQRGR